MASERTISGSSAVILVKFAAIHLALKPGIHPLYRVRCGLRSDMNAHASARARFSIPSVIAIIAAIASFAVQAFWGFVLAMVAVVFGVLGLLLAFSSRTRGGFISILAVGAGILGLIAAIIKGVAWLL